MVKRPYIKGMDHILLEIAVPAPTPFRAIEGRGARCVGEDPLILGAGEALEPPVDFKSLAVQGLVEFGLPFPSLERLLCTRDSIVLCDPILLVPAPPRHAAIAELMEGKEQLRVTVAFVYVSPGASGHDHLDREARLEADRGLYSRRFPDIPTHCHRLEVTPAVWKRWMDTLTRRAFSAGMKNVLFNQMYLKYPIVEKNYEMKEKKVNFLHNIKLIDNVKTLLFNQHHTKKTP